MRTISLAALLFASALSAEAAPPSQTEKAAALARLYGVVRWFHPSDAAQEIDWDRFAVKAAGDVRAAATAEDLMRTLRVLFAPVAVRVVIDRQLPASQPQSTVARDEKLVAWRHLGPGFGSAGGGIYASARTHRPGQPPFEAPLRADAHVDLDLGPGLRARVPLVLTEGEANIGTKQRQLLAALQEQLAAWPQTLDTADHDVRAADVIVAWSVLRHFFPYWRETGVDWDEQLSPLLEAAAAPASRAAHRDLLRRLTVRFRDGHGRVGDPRAPAEKSLPIAMRWLDGRLVVMASGVPEQVRAGDVVVSADGRPAASWFAEAEALQSGSPQHRMWRAVRALFWGPEGSRVALELEREGERVRVEVSRGGKNPWWELRPEPIAEIRPGIFYVDLERAKWATVQPRLPELARASAVVFDLRGYTSDAGSQVLPHLMTAAEHDDWMHTPHIAGPFGRFAGWKGYSWHLEPASPRIGGKVVFLTDARAVSASESVLGYVDALRLGTIVGGPTAGANGNAITFNVPSGMTVTFTGMRVTGHDGSPFHLSGVRPAVPVEPTLAGIRAGRDEVLERALSILGR
jgi:hypothetical protein